MTGKPTTKPPTGLRASTTAHARLASISAHMAAGVSAFPASIVPLAPEDPLFGLSTAYRADGFPQKVDLGVGAYRDDNAKPWVLPVVKKVKFSWVFIFTSLLFLIYYYLWEIEDFADFCGDGQAEEILRSDPELNHEYLPITGLPAFTSAAARVILGADSPAIKEKRVSNLPVSN